jgi:hypothetical protein
MAMQEPMTIKGLATYTGYDRKSVAIGLEKLQVLELAERTPDECWRYVSQVVWGEIPNPCSSSYIESIESLNTTLLKPLLQPNVGRISEHQNGANGAGNHATHFAQLVETLTKARCSKSKAKQAIETALHLKTLDAIESDIEAWLSYCQSDDGKSIKNHGFFVAAKLRNGEAPPDLDTDEYEEFWQR